MRMPNPLKVVLPTVHWIANVVSEMIWTVAVPVYFEPLGLVPTSS